MSRFNNQSHAISYLMAQVENLKARIGRLTTSGGNVRVTSTTIVGGLPAHDHSNTANAGQVEYTPTIPSNWNGNSDPGNVWQALDQLAARIKAIEGVIIGIPAVSYPSNTMMFNGMEG